MRHSTIWLALFASATVIAAAFIGVAGALAATRSSYDFWGGGPMIAAYGEATGGLRPACRATREAAQVQESGPSRLCGDTSEFLDELAQFPNGRHDDCVDALSGALNALGRRHPIYCTISVARGSIPRPSYASGPIWSWADSLSF